MDQQLFSGIRIARHAPFISHLFFADDSLLFFKASDQGPTKIVEALNLYSKASGQLINYEKSTLTFNPGARPETVAEVTRIFGVQTSQSHSIYLGLPTFMMRSRRLQFGYLAERVSKRIGGWMNKSFSMGGKKILIKSIIQSIPTYTMACFRVPVSVCDDIERLCAQFWWGDTKDGKKMHWSSWDKLCKPKSKGGLGFRKLVSFNQALLAKQVWRLIRFPQSFVARVLKAKYYDAKDIMDAKLSSNASFMWRSILWGRELLQKGIRWKVGDGKTIRVFHDAWLPSLPNGKTIQNAVDNRVVHVVDLVNDDLQWDMEKMEDLLLPVEIEEVFRCGKPDTNKNDLRYWCYDEKGNYNVKSGYLVATNYYTSHDSSSDNMTSNWWKFIWIFDLSPRVRIFAWRVFHNIIPTEMYLLLHHVPVDGGCKLCLKGWGYTSHSLIFCEKVPERWKIFDFWSKLKRWAGRDIGEIGEALRVWISRDDFAIWLMGLWLTWNDLCSAKHKQKPMKSIDLWKESKLYMEGYILAKNQAACQTRYLPMEGSRNWKSLKKGRYRLDVDYAVDEKKNCSGVGAIVRDDKNNIIMAMAKPISKSTSILHGELRALMFGICQCVEDVIFPLEVFSDSLLAIHVLEEQNEEDSMLCEEFFHFFAEVKHVNVLSINHVRREANIAAHGLASLAKSLDSTSVWYDAWPPWLVDIVMSD